MSQLGQPNNDDAMGFYRTSYPAMQHASFQPDQMFQHQDDRTGILLAFSAAGFDGEPPLLEELGVNFNHIKVKTLTVLNPLGVIDTHIMDDTDLFGPLIFGVLFGFILLLSGKVHFGYVYGCALMGCLSIWTILSLMAPASTSFSRTASVLGYCLLPLVVVSTFGMILNMDTLIGYAMTSAAVFWSTFSASAIFVSVLQMSDMRVLVAYPVALFYSIFAILTLFAEKTVIST